MPSLFDGGLASMRILWTVGEFYRIASAGTDDVSNEVADCVLMVILQYRGTLGFMFAPLQIRYKTKNGRF